LGQGFELSNLRFHYSDLAVEMPAAGGEFLSSARHTLGEPAFDPLQDVCLTLCEHPSMYGCRNHCKGDGGGPPDRCLVKHREGLVYHFCLTTTKLERTLLAIFSSRAYCGSPPKPSVLFGGKVVCFYQIAAKPYGERTPRCSRQARAMTRAAGTRGRGNRGNADPLGRRMRTNDPLAPISREIGGGPACSAPSRMGHRPSTSPRLGCATSLLKDRQMRGAITA
jgi:hypothetical protein